MATVTAIYLAMLIPALAAVMNIVLRNSPNLRDGMTLAAAVVAFPIAYYAARYARGRWKALFYGAGLVPYGRDTNDAAIEAVGWRALETATTAP